MEPDFNDMDLCCYCKSFAICDKWYEEPGIEKAKSCMFFLFDKEIIRKSDNYTPVEYDKSQCVYGPDNKMPCEICSATCNERAKHFEEQGKKKYTIGNIFFWK